MPSSSISRTRWAPSPAPTRPSAYEIPETLRFSKPRPAEKFSPSGTGLSLPGISHASPPLGSFTTLGT